MNAKVSTVDNPDRLRDCSLSPPKRMTDIEESATACVSKQIGNVAFMSYHRRIDRKTI
jgi:hypothetical protein